MGSTKSSKKSAAKKTVRTPGRVSAKLRQSVWVRDLGRCVYCRKISKHMTVDHIIPQADGGPHAAHNLVTCCSECNGLRSRCPLDLWAVWCERRGCGTPAAVLARVATALATPVRKG